MEDVIRHIRRLQQEMRPGEFREIRALGETYSGHGFGWRCGLFTAGADPDQILQEILYELDQAWIRRRWSEVNLYFSANVSGDIPYPKQVTNTRVNRILIVPLDLDVAKLGQDGKPMLDGQGKKIKCMATDTERESASRAMRHALRRIGERWGIGEGDYVLVDSGNGLQAHFAVDWPPTRAEDVKLILEYWAHRLDSEFVRLGLPCNVDKGISNPGRILRLAGTRNVKGIELPGRPYRLTRLLHVPEKVTACNERMEEILAEARRWKPAETPKVKARISMPTPPPRGRSGEEHCGGRFDELNRALSMPDYLSRYHGSEIVGRRSRCPFHGGSNPTSLHITQETCYCFVGGCVAHEGLNVVKAIMVDQRLDRYGQVLEWAEKEGWIEPVFRFADMNF